MDTSKEYIKQSEKAEKIQAKHFDFMGVIRKASIQTSIADSPGVFETMGNTYYGVKENIVWLPHQDQLQEMIANKERLQMPFFIINDIYQWGNKNLFAQYTSMEQLWLAFVMKELYQKQWNGEDWIKEV